MELKWNISWIYSEHFRQIKSLSDDGMDFTTLKKLIS